MTTTIMNTSENDHIVASERYRLQTFESLTNFPQITHRQFALAGLIYRRGECLCSQCGIKINLEYIGENVEYDSNHFRKLHRRKVSLLGKRCSFLLCEPGTNIDDLHNSSSSQQQAQWNDAEVPEYNSYTERLQSFKSWPKSKHETNEAEKIFVTPEAMAKHGFYYSGPHDSVTCFYCGNTLTDWSLAISSTNENIVQLEHARFFPCRFINYTAGRKFVASAGYFHTVSFEERRKRNPMTAKLLTVPKIIEAKPRTIDECLATFENWPSSAPISANALASAGFYYLGEEFKVKCFMCNLEVDDWRHGMTAFGTHQSRKNDCEVVQAIECTKTGNIQTVNEKWRLETLADLSFTQSNTVNVNQKDNDQLICCELAACGFYRFKNTKIIRCAYCGVTIEPKSDRSIMSQHRYLAKQIPKVVNTDGQQQKPNLDCPLVRAQCPANIVISDRKPFPEYRQYQSIFSRIQSFENYKERHKLDERSIRDRAEAGFFLHGQRRMRCFQCGNALASSDKKRREEYSQYNMAQLHAHFYPTCEWVKEILGAKYIAQVLCDRYKSNESQTQISFDAQSSTSSQGALHSSSSVPTPIIPIVDKSSKSENIIGEFPMSDHSEESSDDEYSVFIPQPPTAGLISGIASVRSSSSSIPATEVSTTENARICLDSVFSNGSHHLTLPSITNQINPFEQLVLRQEQKRDYTDGNGSPENVSHEISPSLDSSKCVSSPVDIRSLLAHESNRLDTFKKNNRETFAQVDVAHLAYVGLYLNAEGTAVQCPWCDISLTEQRFESIVCTRPTVARPSLIDEPWTPMRVHRHENGILMDQNHSWCTWVRRETGGLYPNVTMLKSQMLYPEYPSYSIVEKRMKSFTSDWPYPSGSRLSNQMMAEAGFFYIGEGGVCCYYCGNKLQKFEPRDCPFEEHATFYPLCDFIQKVRGLDYINRIILECGRIPKGRLKFETDGEQKIKRIVFDKSRETIRKSGRTPANRITSSSSCISNRDNLSPETIDNACLICSELVATYEYDPCQHVPMCGECFARLDHEQLQKCMCCFRAATIRIRIPNTPQ